MKLTDKQKRVLEAIRNLPDDEIDTSDIPEVLDWSNARRGLLYRPVKKEVTLNLDEYVIEWFESTYSGGPDMSQAINDILMEYIRGQTFPAQKK